MPRDEPVSRSGLDELLARGGLGPRAHQRALRLAGFVPGRDEWRGFFETFLLVVGSALLLAAVVCFFAFNWSELSRFQKLGLVGGAIGLTFLASLALGDRLSGKVALLASSVLVGVFLAVFGQIYQTGADEWELFAGWAALIALWAIGSRFTGHWLLLWVLTNTALSLYLQQEMGHIDFWFSSPRQDFILMIALNAGWLVAWEALRTIGWQWTQPRYLPRLMASSLVAYVTFPMISVASGHSLPELPDWAVFASWAAVLGVGAAFYVVKAKDIFMVAAGFASLLWVVDTPVFKGMLAQGDVVALFLVGAILLCEAGGAVYFMVNLERKWKKSGNVP